MIALCLMRSLLVVLAALSMDTGAPLPIGGEDFLVVLRIDSQPAVFAVFDGVPCTDVEVVQDQTVGPWVWYVRIGVPPLPSPSPHVFLDVVVVGDQGACLLSWEGKP